MFSGKTSISPECPDYKCLSRRLYRALEDIGASVEVREAQIEQNATREILMTLCVRHSKDDDDDSQNSTITGKRSSRAGSFYIFGSSFEGTSTPGLNSDVDYMHVHEDVPAVTDTVQAQNYTECLLMVQDPNTQAGYFKLQYVENGVPCSVDCYGPHVGSCPPTAFSPSDRHVFSVDKDGRIVADIARGSSLGERHGPAFTKRPSKGKKPSDFVPAVRCRTWPDCASEWLTRQRHYNCPAEDLIDICKTLGCFLVQVGHPNSVENRQQWRISFSLQERLLVTRFNSIQLKCYILLKMIKKEIINHTLGTESVSSYHCKTCLLYLIENTPADFWTEDNLLACLHNCLKMILTWVASGVCPNYFIPAENMFDGKLSTNVRVRLMNLLEDMLSADFKYLIDIKSDGLGDIFKEYKATGQRSARHSSISIADFAYSKEMHALLSFMMHSRNLFLKNCETKDTQGAVKQLHLLKEKLLKTERVNEHLREETQKAVSLVLPYVEVSLMSCLTVLAVRSGKDIDMLLNSLKSDTWHEVRLKSDLFSSSLKQASLLYMLRFYDISLSVLLPLQNLVRITLSLCKCGFNTVRSPALEMMFIKVSSAKELLNKNLIPCSVYLPAENDLTPLAISYEMNLRSVGFIPAYQEKCYNWAIVDGKILFYFLLYLNHSAIGMEANATADVENMVKIIRTDYYLGHRETAFNLLGWVYKERGLVDQAVECFQNSVVIQPRHNAAFWHMLDIVRMKSANRSQRE